jgi:hypothetical protein
MAPKRPKSLLRLLTLWIGLSCILGQFSGVAHSLLVEHVRCAEHGDWAHGHDDSHGAGLQAQLARAPQAAGALASESGDEHGHEHCLSCVSRGETVLPGEDSSVQHQAARQHPAPEFGPGAVVVLQRVFSFAPKTSPPV